MKGLLIFVPLGALFLPNLASAQSVFDGTWKVDMNKVDFPKEPDVYLLQNGMYSCKTCTPPYNIKADGSDQPVTGHPYFDSIAIKVVSDRQLDETDKKDGKVVATSTTMVSSDGKTLLFNFTDSSDTNGGPPVTGKGEAMLVTKGPAGSHAVSGAWRTTKIEGMSDNATVLTYKVAGDSITMSTPTGQTYTAKLDGTEAPMQGDVGVSSVSVKKIGDNVLEETDKRDGKPISVVTFTVDADGKSGKVVALDARQNRTTTFTVVKQ